jgi:serine/threonine-protein kinase
MVERSEDGEWKPFVLDFGLAREQAASGLTATGIVIGTIEYMSPEQARGAGELLDRRSDVYGLGATLFEVLTGRPPFQGESIMGTMMKVLQADPPSLRSINPRLPIDLETIVAKCLEKEPHRRYESARALAEDLQRYLEGESILARPASYTYRLLRKVGKHRLAFGVSTAAILMALAFAALGITARLESGRRAALAYRYGQEIKELESTLRFARLLPLHDTKRERALVIARVKRMESESRAGGKGARGPGLYAIGRVAMALHDYDVARGHLERAWREEEYRLPEVAYALGITLVRLYQRELEVAERIANADLRKARRAELDQQFGKPAREYIGRSRGAATESPEYGEALLALMEKRYPAAIANAAAARAKISWLYEADPLVGDAHMAIGREAADKGDYAAADEGFRRAGENYGRAAQKGQSDESIRLSDADRWLGMMGIDSNRGISPDRSLEGVIEACDAAIAIDPELGGSYVKKAAAYRRFGDHLLYHSSTDPRGAYQRAIEMTRQAASRNPRDATTYSLMGDSYLRIGEYEASIGVDPSASLKQAIGSQQKALQIDPALTAAHHGVGYGYWLTGSWEDSHGGDPTTSFRMAIESYQSAIGISPRYVASHLGAGNVCMVLGQRLNARGEDAAGTFERAIGFYRQCLSINPNLAIAWSNLGMAHWLIGGLRSTQGEDPRPSLKEAIACCQRAVQIDPQYAYGHMNMGLAHMDTGRYEMGRGRDPRESLRNAESCFKAAMAINAGIAMAHSNLGEALFLEGVYESLRGEDPRPILRRAIEQSREAARINSELDLAYLRLANSYRALALYSVHRGDDPARSIDHARDVIARGLKTNPELASFYAVRGQVEILAARWSMMIGRSPLAELRKASDAFDKAVSLNRRDSDALAGMAELHRWEADWKWKRADASDASIAAGLSAIEKALAIDPEVAENVALKGTLLLARSRLKGGREAAAAASACLDKALQLNPLLDWEYGKAASEARALLTR